MLQVSFFTPHRSSISGCVKSLQQHSELKSACTNTDTQICPSLPASHAFSLVFSALVGVKWLLFSVVSVFQSKEVKGCGEPDTSKTLSVRKDAVAMVTEEPLGSFGH